MQINEKKYHAEKIQRGRVAFNSFGIFVCFTYSVDHISILSSTRSELI